MRALTALAAGLLLMTQAQAQRIYMCRDDAGHMLSSDRPIAECSRHPMRELDRSGITRREIAAPLSAEEKQRQIEEEARRRAEREAQAEQRRSDRALLARFRSEADIEAARKTDAGRVRENAGREAQALERARQRQQTLEARLALNRGGNEAPELQRQLQEADRAVSESRRRLDDYEAEIMQIDARMDAMARRFRELKP
jgi:chromosome segregation ATPase